ncbi:OsmC family protein [Sulfitobacter aestuariivivens]|uniref:OsmC family protein n=1 Tax=Sulfitobacter aestuariivivens TaxID=2766981 RepID=A0A927HFY0_9RHOB|nr:OsmC family protein [Sulfitobacter aestuariivivens]MBD3664899.1 OsmC family protein [Sulfitobacter aestuariivivens]
MEVTQPKEPLTVTFICNGQAVGKMRNELDVRMTEPMEEHFSLATDEGPFHGGDATAPPPLALFVGGLTGCLMTQLRAFAKRMDVTINDLRVETRVCWQWTPHGRIYETAPKSFDIDIFIDSGSSFDDQIALIKAAKKGCFVEQTLGQKNTITHRIRTGQGFVRIDG